jgi:hypothetical protein
VPGYGKGEFRRRGWFGMERGRWGRLFGLGEDELEFFELHTEADIEHSDTGWRAVEKFAKSSTCRTPRLPRASATCTCGSTT